MQKIHDSICKAYGSLTQPNFGFVQKIDFSRYGRYVHILTRRFWLHETTDENEDVCFSFLLKAEDCRFSLEISRVDGYAMLMNLENREIYTERSDELPADICDTIIKMKGIGLIFLDKETLSQPIAMRLFYAENPTIFNALFSDVERLPWE